MRVSNEERPTLWPLVDNHRGDESTSSTDHEGLQPRRCCGRFMFGVFAWRSR